jgi:hypothetical protein
MTNFEITLNLFKNLTNIERVEFIKQSIEHNLCDDELRFDDLRFDKIEGHNGYIITKPEMTHFDVIFEQASKFDTDGEMICLNFVNAVGDDIINTINDKEANELLSLYENGTTNFYKEFPHDIYMNMYENMCWNISYKSIEYGHKFHFEQDLFNIISYKELKRRLIFKPKLK